MRSRARRARATTTATFTPSPAPFSTASFAQRQFDRFEVKAHGLDLIDKIHAQGGGCFLLGAHLGSFEVLRTLARTSTNHEVSMVMYEQNARKVGAVLDAINPRLGLDVIGLGNSDSMLRVSNALARGRFVGMLGDRNFMNEASRRAAFRPHTHCPVGPFRMAAMLKCPLVLMWACIAAATATICTSSCCPISPGCRAASARARSKTRCKLTSTA